MSFVVRFLMTAAISALPFASPARAGEPDAYAKFVIELKDKALEYFKPGVSEADRLSAICKIIEDSSDYKAMGDTVIPSVRKRATDADLEPYYAGFKAMLADLFTDAFGMLSGSAVDVESLSKPMGDLHIVTVHVEARGRTDERLQFFVTEDKLLVDASVGGILLTRHRRSEYEGIMNRSGAVDVAGKLKAVTEHLTGKYKACP
jgi:ABC-type transporter MlaC component